MKKLQLSRHVARHPTRLFVAIAVIALAFVGFQAHPALGATGTPHANFASPTTTSQSGYGLAFDGQFLYWTSSGDTNIYKITPSTGGVASTISTSPALSFQGPDVGWPATIGNNVRRYAVWGQILHN